MGAILGKNVYARGVGSPLSYAPDQEYDGGWATHRAHPGTTVLAVSALYVCRNARRATSLAMSGAPRVGLKHYRVGLLGGTGAEGRALALRLARGGWEVVIGSRSADRAVRIAAAIQPTGGGGRVVGATNPEVAQSASIVFITVPFQALDTVLATVADRLAGRIVVDVVNPLRLRDGWYEAVSPAEGSVTEYLQARLPNARIVSGLKTISAGSLALDAPIRGHVFVCGDDPEAKEVLCDLLAGIGASVIDAGALRAARDLERVTAFLLNLNRRLHATTSLRVVTDRREGGGDVLSNDSRSLRASPSSVTLDEWRRHGHTFDYRGHPIFYRDDGAGDVVLLIHGFPTASYDWCRVWPGLRDRFRLVAPDMLGFGFSAKPVDYDYSIHDQATLHEELLRRLKIAHCHILAHDYGDTVAQELLARHAERRKTGSAGAQLGSVCFLNGGLFPETHRARPIQRLLAGPLGSLLARFMSERGFARSFAAIFGPGTRPTAEELHDFWRLVAFNDGPRVAHRLIRYMEERRRHRQRWVGVLLTTPVPLRVINGPEDPVSGGHMAERYRELVPNPDVVLLDGIGHYPQFEAPEGVVREYLAFLQRVRARHALS